MATQLPPLRQELDLFPSPASHDGSPTWSLHDPSSGKFYLLSRAAFEILTRWNIGTTDDIISSVNRETTLEIGSEDVAELAGFLDRNFLLDRYEPAQTSRFIDFSQKNSPGAFIWFIKNYLFFRVPLFNPQKLLELLYPRISWMFSPLTIRLTFASAVLALFILTGRWDHFTHSFTEYRSLEGLLFLGCALPLAKAVHELGHAFAAHRYGCRVPAMGVVFMVMVPMLYTDTNEAWKLRSKKARLIIGSAGIAAELILAVAATYAWLILPEGPLRGATFVLASVTWIMTLTLNASPFMRFDGYFLLSDLLSIPNLHSRSFAFGCWALREALFGWNDPPPEVVSLGRRYFLTAFAFMVWIYRLTVFLGIALLVYHYFFKALGIILFSIEIGWFILFPAAGETAVWWRRRHDMRPNAALIRTLALFVAGGLFLAVPWKTSVKAPAVLSARFEHHISAPSAALVKEKYTDIGREVKRGEPLIRLMSPDLDSSISRSMKSEEVARWQARQQPFHEDLLSQGGVVTKRLDGAKEQVSGLREQRGRLSMTSPIDGKIVYMNEDLFDGAWVRDREKLFIVADMSGSRIEAFVGEEQLERIKPGAEAVFIPGVPELEGVKCKVSLIDRVNMTTIEEPSLSSVYGGPVPSRLNRHGEPVPLEPLFRVRLDSCKSTPVTGFRLKGTAHIEAAESSRLAEMIKHLYFVFQRESGF